MAKLTAIELGNAMKEQFGHKVISNANKPLWPK